MYDEDEEARRLLAPLAGPPTGPSTVDIRRAMTDGRRRLRTRRVTGVAAAAAVTALVAAGVPVALDAAGDQPVSPPVAASPARPASPTPAPWPTTPPVPEPDPPTRCDLELLPVPVNARDTFAFGTDPTGRLIYGRYFVPADDPDGVRVQPVLWVDGDPIPVDLPGEDARLTAVNSSGAAVGTSLVGTTEEEIHEVSWFYQDGEVTELAGGRTVRTITEQGVAVGNRVVWRSPQALPEDLVLPGSITRIEADGTVVGLRPGSTRRSFLWRPDGTVLDIPSPTIDGETFEYRAWALTGQTVVGEATLFRPVEDGGEVVHVLRYDLATGEFTNLSEAAPIRPLALNRHGWFVGETDGFAGLWTPDGELVSLPDLGVHNEFGPNHPYSVSDDGRTITGVVEDLAGRVNAAVWSCR